MNEIQINFVAPFATGIIIDPQKLEKASYKSVQKAFKKILTENLDIEFEAKQLPKDEYTNMIFSQKTQRHISVYPDMLVEAILAEQEISNLSLLFMNSGETISTKYVSSSYYEDIHEFQIEIREINIGIYHYGFGNLTIKTIVKLPDNFLPNDELRDGCHDTNKLEKILEKRYEELRDFIQDCAQTKKEKIKYGCPIICQFIPLVKTIQKVIAEGKRKSLQRFSKNYHERIENLSDKIIINKKGFLWVHKLFYIPIPSNSRNVHTVYGRKAREVFGDDVLGTKVYCLSNKKCKIAYLSSRNSFALVHDMIPLSQVPDSYHKDYEKDEKYIDENRVTASLTNVIQTVGVLDAATIDLVFLLDLFIDFYEIIIVRNRQETRNEAIENLVQRISHIRTMSYQYHFSLPLVGKKVFEAIERTWTMDERYDYIDWKFEALTELHDRGTSKRLNRTALTFSIIGAIGVLLMLFSIAQNGKKLPIPSFDLWGSLVSLLFIPIVLFLFVVVVDCIIIILKMATASVKKIFYETSCSIKHITLSDCLTAKLIRQIESQSIVISIIFYFIMVSLFFIAILLANLIFDFDLNLIKKVMH